MTDNRNRAAADVRHAFSKQGGNLGESGCVGWMFKSKGVFVIDKEGHDEDELTMFALEAGAQKILSLKMMYLKFILLLKTMMR